MEFHYPGKGDMQKLPRYVHMYIRRAPYRIWGYGGQIEIPKILGGAMQYGSVNVYTEMGRGGGNYA